MWYVVVQGLTVNKKKAIPKLLFAQHVCNPTWWPNWLKGALKSCHTISRKVFLLGCRGSQINLVLCYVYLLYN